MINVKFLNHSSVLIQEGNSFVLTDPWYESISFGSWLSVPPCSVHPAYLVALSKQVDDFTIAISHGHDDHLDDSFLSLFPSNTKVVIPKYRSKGLIKRINRAGLTNIHEVDEQGESVGGFTFKSYINPVICPDDAIITIAGKKHFIVHANDNWQKLEESPLNKITSDAQTYGSKNRLYMSQCNLADGWPDIYRDYTEEEKVAIHKNRVENIITNTISNAEMVGCEYFLNYAGHASAFVNDDSKLRAITSFVSNKTVSDLVDKRFRIQVLDMVPGDSFDFKQVIKQFAGVTLEDTLLKESSWDFYKSYGLVSKCDSQRLVEEVSDYPFKIKMDYFLSAFEKFVISRVYKSNFNSDIVGFKVVLKSPTETAEIIIGGEEKFDNKTVIFHIENGILKLLLSGEIIWENLYIGYEAEVETVPPKINVRAPVRWLASFGYVYQIRSRNV
tara:strand:+ start:217 stop:1548 length:1332 start_codon:yes stop_codon:yes gene_type:complete